MSVDYSILLESDEPIQVVKAQLEKMIGSPLVLSDNWKESDLYYTEVLGLWIQLSDCRKEMRYEGELAGFSYEVDVGYVRRITGLSEGKE